jgi:hypothetical protein
VTRFIFLATYPSNKSVTEAKMKTRAAHCDLVGDGVIKKIRKTGMRKILRVVRRLGRFKNMPVSLVVDDERVWFVITIPNGGASRPTVLGISE